MCSKVMLTSTLMGYFHIFLPTLSMHLFLFSMLATLYFHSNNVSCGVKIMKTVTVNYFFSTLSSFTHPVCIFLLMGQNQTSHQYRKIIALKLYETFFTLYSPCILSYIIAFILTNICTASLSSYIPLHM
jgi:hypothetical protein